MMDTKIKIIDSTLREGLQSIYYENIETMKSQYIDTVNQLGVFDFEYKNVLFNENDFNELTSLLDKFPNSNFFVHFYLNEKNVNRILSIPDIKYVSTFIPFPLGDDGNLTILRKLLLSDKQVRVSIENGFQMNDDELKSIILLLSTFDSVNRISFSDTLGTLSPSNLTEKIKKYAGYGFFKEHNIEFHLHNDRGLAMANALAIIENLSLFSKNVYFSVSAFGLGDRNGILSLQNLIANLRYIGQLDDQDLTHISSLNKLLEERKINFDNNPLGTNAFRHSAFSHIKPTLENKYSFIDPVDFGMNNQVVILCSFSDNTIIEILKKVECKNINETLLKIKNEFSRGKKFFTLNISNHDIF